VKLLLTMLKIMPVPEGVVIQNFGQFMDEVGPFQPNELMEKNTTTMLGEFVRWFGAVKPLPAA
jgi:hypothetical protein